MKHCYKCKTCKDVSLFGKAKDKKDGYASICKACDKERNAVYRNKNKATINIKAVIYHESNKEQINNNKKLWYVKNKEIKLLKNKQWALNNKDKRRAHRSKRRAIELNATPLWLIDQDYKDIQDFYTMAKELENVFPWKQHVDHVIPLQNKSVCGLHVPWNMQILSVKANLEKGNSFVL